MIFAISFLFVAGYICIALEHKLHLNKALTASALGGIVWAVVALFEPGEKITHALHETGGEIFGLVAFLIAAMTLVEMLIHYRFFDVVRAKLLKYNLDDLQQLWVIGSLTFAFSAIIDNLTATIVMVQIARRFFRGHNLLVAAAVIVVASNAGGAFSPVGDITTLMLWLAGKFSALEIISWALLPSLALTFVSITLMARKIVGDTQDIIEEGTTNFKLASSEWVVVGTILASFTLPVVFHLVHLEPYLGLLTGLGIVGILIAVFRVKAITHETHLTADMEDLVRKVDLSSILFFVGILLTVSAMQHVGILAMVSDFLFGESPTLARTFFSNIGMGVLSAIVDNIPITAAAMDIIATTDHAIWALLAIAVGTGGSLLVIGSAAGVVAMGMIKQLTFKKYFSIAFVPALAGYITAMVVWLAQYVVIRVL